MTGEINCGSCGQKIEFEVEDFSRGQETNCPTCGAEVVPIPPVAPPPIPESKPEPMAAPGPSPVAPAPPQAVVVGSRRGPFSWGCFGGLGVMAALVGLACLAIMGGAIFFGVPYRARRTAQQQPQTQMEPQPSINPLDDAEKALAEEFLASDRCKREHDSFERRTEYSLASAIQNLRHLVQQGEELPLTTVVFNLSFYRKDSGPVEPLSITISYRHDSMFHNMDTVKVLVGEGLFEYPISNVESAPLLTGGFIETTGWWAYIWKDMLDELRRAGSSQSVAVRVQGKPGRIDQVLTQGQIEDLKDMVLLYRYFGGAW